MFYEVKKKATIAIVLDKSSSMSIEKLETAKISTVDFLKRRAPQDELLAFVFNHHVTPLAAAGLSADVNEELQLTVQNIFAGAGTALYDAVCASVKAVAARQEKDVAAGERRFYGAVLLADGADSASDPSERGMFKCLPSGEDVEGIKVFTIAYGADANKDVLTQIANQTNGRAFAGDTKNLQDVYTSISAEQ